ncbi:MAG: DUF1828 domain-containing protein [Planctomycetes bacterium]|nr:DUF1828 domain-containing protein [Planctomycetota bacterium]
MSDYITDISNAVAEQFNHRFRLIEKRPNIFQIYLPFYHEDGDMIEVYIDLRNAPEIPSESTTIRISDFGMSLMRLSYSYEIDTPNKEKIFNRILLENGLRGEQGHIVYDAEMRSLYPGLMQFCQTVAKICNMRQFKREVIDSLFFETLDEFIFEKLNRFRPEKAVIPIPERDDIEVDYQFIPNGHPVFLFGVKDSASARLATIGCLEFLRNDLKFKSIIVHEDFDKLTKKDRNRLTRACDKQFTSLDDFISNAEKFLAREA